MRRSSGFGALLVGAGILLSRFAGLIRERAFAYAFGSSDAADVFRAALRIPNLLQNLFGEGVLSASFIPVYAGLVDRDPNAARRVAGVVLGVLSLVTSVVVLLGIVGAPMLADVLAPGFEGEKRLATIKLVRILFPGVGLLVFSAWCLGILNSHRKLFISYVAPVAWNAAIIAVLLLVDASNPYAAIEWVAWGAVLGSALQLLVQLPFVLPLLPGLRPAIDLANEHVKTVLSNFFPVLASRGVVQISGYVESMLASLLGAGAVAAMGYAQILSTLPVSLFGMAIAAAELPEMSRVATGTDENRKAFSDRISAGSKRMAFFIVPSALAFLFIGDVISAIFFETGRFSKEDSLLVWAVLGGSSVGLYASTQGRLLVSAFAAFKDMKTPLRFSILRVITSTGLGVLFALWGPGLLGLRPIWGIAGLALGTSVGALMEWTLLNRALHQKLAYSAVPVSLFAKLLGAAAASGAVAYGTRLVVAPYFAHPILSGGLVVAAFGAVYGGLTVALGVPEARRVFDAVLRRVRRR